MARYTYIPLKTYLDTYTSDPPPTPTLPPFCTKNGEIGVNTPISPFVKYAYLSLVKYAYFFPLVNNAMNILQFSPCKLWRSRTTSIWLRFRRECNRWKAMSLYFRMVLFCCRIEPYSKTYGNFAKMAQDFLQRRTLLYNDLVDY